MRQLVRNSTAGVVSGVATFATSVLTMGYTSAIAMPASWPLALWEALIVFGIGAVLVALAIHAVALWLSAANARVSLAAFAFTVLAASAASGYLTTSYKIIPAWLVGALLASAMYSRLRSNNSSKPTPLRGAA